MKQVRRPPTSWDNRFADSLLPPSVVQTERFTLIGLRESFGDTMIVLEVGCVGLPLQLDPASVDIESARTVGEDVRGDGLRRKWFASYTDRFVCRLERSTPPLPLLGFRRGRCKVVMELVCVITFLPRTLPPFIPIVMCEMAGCFPTCELGVTGLYPDNLSSSRPGLLVNSLAHILTFRETRPVDPHDLIPNLKTGVFDSNDHAVISAGARERQKVPSWFQHAKCLAPNINARYVIVPVVPHEGQTVWWVRTDRVNRVVGETSHYLDTVTLEKLKTHISPLKNPV